MMNQTMTGGIHGAPLKRYTRMTVRQDVGAFKAFGGKLRAFLGFLFETRKGTEYGLPENLHARMYL